jgi:hypothetical protein
MLKYVGYGKQKALFRTGLFAGRGEKGGLKK